MPDDTIELARWQGRTDAHMAENSRRLDGINGSVERIERDVNGIRVDVTALKTKLAFWSAAGGLVGAGIVTSTIALITNAHL